MYKVSIPDLTESQLLKRYSRIKPIATINGIKHFFREFSKEELKNESYIWSLESAISEQVDMTSLRPLPELDFECIHKYSFYGFFKPSIAEILAQISESHLEIVHAFEIIESPITTGDFARNKIVFENGYHSSTVRLYSTNG